MVVESDSIHATRYLKVSKHFTSLVRENSMILQHMFNH